jgi:hypothetical protein
MDLKKSVVRAAEITAMQEKAIDCLKEVTAKELSEVFRTASAAFSIETFTTTTKVSHQSTSSVVTVVAAAPTPLIAGQIF